MDRLFLISVIALFLSACESNPPAPVIDRQPQSSKPKPPVIAPASTKNGTATKSTDGKDWRPDTYVVKKGDTLFSIGLEYGFEYKEIAAANNIIEPYTIHIGQKLNLAGLKAKSDAADNEPAQNQTEDGVVVTPIGTDPAVKSAEIKPGEAKPAEVKPSEVKPAETKPIQSSVTPILSEPKALREKYSVEAFNKTTAVKVAETKAAETGKAIESKPAESKPADAKTNDVKATDAKPGDDESMAWGWPTQGKIVANFNEATNKGLDIGGSTGQAINAASSGKVIYSGSDLRGYGKLVIIKHNKTYLSVYAHNSKIIVKEGQVVALGQKIAEMGNTDSNSVKLHFEIRRLGKSVDPARYLNQN
ncbi:MAG: peptidoglycan DD-metalloendopeptidase family protein [Pseudomonadota bacterium]